MHSSCGFGLHQIVRGWWGRGKRIIFLKLCSVYVSLPSENIQVLQQCVNDLCPYVVLSLFFSWEDGNVEHWCVLPMRMGSALGWKEKKTSCWNITAEIQLNIGGRHDGYTSAFGKVPRKCRWAPVKVSSLCSWGQHPRDGVKPSLCQAPRGSLLLFWAGLLARG